MTSRMPEALVVLCREIAFLQGNAKRERERGHQNAALVFDSRVSGICKARDAFAAEHEALLVAREWLRCDKWRNSTTEKHASWKALMRGIDAAIAAAEELK